MTTNKNKRYGKHRAIVVDIVDPQKRGRVRVKCPTIFGESLSGWCEACVVNYKDSLGDFIVPAPNDPVWLEFEDGNVSYPIYSGGWYTAKPPEDRVIGYKGSSIHLSEQGIELKTPDGTTIKVSSGNIYINGSPVALKSELHSH